MQKLELKIPPVATFLFCIMLMYYLNTLQYKLTLNLPTPEIVFAVCFCLSGLFGLAGLYQFKKDKTTVHPVAIHKTTTIVKNGIYRVSRNPMYVGLLLLLLGYGYWQQNGMNFLVCAGFVLFMNRFQIEPEEKHLEQKFGQEYIEYKKKVRRWI